MREIDTLEEYEYGDENHRRKVGECISILSLSFNASNIEETQKQLEHAVDLARRHPVVIYLEGMQKQRVLDFVLGGIYIIGGGIKKVTNDVYVLAPQKGTIGTE